MYNGDTSAKLGCSKFPVSHSPDARDDANTTFARLNGSGNLRIRSRDFSPTGKATVLGYARHARTFFFPSFFFPPSFFHATIIRGTMLDTYRLS